MQPAGQQGEGCSAFAFWRSTQKCFEVWFFPFFPCFLAHKNPQELKCFKTKSSLKYIGPRRLILSGHHRGVCMRTFPPSHVQY